MVFEQSQDPLNEPEHFKGKELTQKRDKAKRHREQELQTVQARNEAIYEHELSKRMRLLPATNEAYPLEEMPQEEASSSMVTMADRECAWLDEQPDREYCFARDDFAVDMESLLRPGEPLIPEKCWACTMTESNSPFAVLETVWLEFLKAVKDAMSRIGSIRYMGQQLYEIFHRDVVIVVRESTDPNVAYEILGKPDEEVWSAYCIMHHFLVHAMDPETLQWVLIKRYGTILHNQLTNGTIVQYKSSGRKVADPKGLATADSIVDTIKKVYSWDVKKMAFSNSNKDVPANISKLSSGRATYTNNSLRKPAGGRLKPW